MVNCSQGDEINCMEGENMKRCCDTCIPACDWCVHFDSYWIDGAFITGSCDIDGSYTDPGKSCEEFHCEKVEQTS
jgi:hypothetical protein